MHLQPRICHTAVRDWSDCRQCSLWRTRRRVALRRDSGPRKRIHLLIVGEAPGEIEDARGLPFVGDSGRVLNNLLKQVKFPFSYTITNMVCCRPMTVIMMDSSDDSKLESGEYELSELEYEVDYEIIDKNRDPTPAEIAACSSHLTELFDELQPHGLVLLGLVAGKYKPPRKIPTLKLVHPAYIVRRELKYLSVKKEARKLEKFLEHIGGIE